MLDRRFEAENELRPVRNHPEHVITVIAADIGHGFTFEIRQMVLQSVPLALASPFGVYVDAEDRKRPLSPRHECSELRFDLLPLRCIDLLGHPDGHGVSAALDVAGSEAFEDPAGDPIPQKALFVLVHPSQTFVVGSSDARQVDGFREAVKVMHGGKSRSARLDCNQR
jgi:hypothetical protein